MAEDVRRRRRGDETRTLIVDAAEQLLRNGSYRDLSVGRVMGEIGYRRTVFYRHFNGLPELVVAVLARQAAAGAPTLAAFQDVADRPIGMEEAREFLRPTVEQWSANGRLIAALRDAAIADGTLGRVIAATQGRLEQAIVTGLERRRAAGGLGAVDLPDAARLLASMSQAYLLQALGHGEVDAEVALDTLALGWVAIVNAL